MLRRIIVVGLIGLIGWAYQAIHPPPPKVCGSPGGPPVTAPRIMLRDGRHLAYKEHGVPNQIGKYKIIFIHGFSSCRNDLLISTLEMLEEMGLYIVTFDRPGYGESDPDPKRTIRSTALDIEELADKLGLGPKFYVIGYSMGGQVVWGCLKYIPHRLAGATLIAPVVNYWWAGFTANLSTEAYYQQYPQDQWALRVAHYLPWLTHWWNTQKWFPSSSVIAGKPKYSPQDLQILPKFAAREKNKEHAKQQGEFESFHRDMMVGFGSWEFDPMDLKDPFNNSEGSVHLWHGDQDGLVPVKLQHHIVEKLPWIHYHEIQGGGHFFAYGDGDGNKESIIKALVLADK